MTVFDLIFKGGGFENKERLENLFMEERRFISYWQEYKRD